ncbi:hypothetical protein AURDEDRAFT_157858 [Auricularia subglabra TFB-10046 SS5]|nr:hypothetical protein AURDEDRAFT_157858 [Auricularia subglabra TFB-10046 SS5]
MPFECSGLRSQLTTEFESRSAGVEDAAQIRHLADELAKASQRILSELVHRWMQGNDQLRRLPDEIVAYCFTFLPLRNRIAASHVSRYWRSVALAHPAVWADIDFYDNLRDEPALLLMALARTGQHPVDLRCPQPDNAGTVAYCLATHMGHIRTLKSFCLSRYIPLTRPAPLLVTLRDSCDHINIPANFLGGQAGRLRTLSVRSVSLPQECPALSTVTHLSLSMPSRVQDAASFSRLFLLCPALQELSLTKLAPVHLHHMPAAPAPKSLSRLYLETMEARYDIMPHYLAWRSEHLTYLEIEQVDAVRDLQPIILGAVEIVVTIERDSGNWTSIIAIGAMGWRRAVSFRHTSVPAITVAEMLLRVTGGLSQVQSLMIPVTALGAFLPVLSSSPVLLELTFTIDLGDLTPDVPHGRFAWNELKLFLQLLERCPRLKLVVLSVGCWTGSCAPTAEDALDILAKLSGMRDSKLPPIQVKGFAEEALRDIVIPNFDGFHVEFS